MEMATNDRSEALAADESSSSVASEQQPQATQTQPDLPPRITKQSLPFAITASSPTTTMEQAAYQRQLQQYALAAAAWSSSMFAMSDLYYQRNLIERSILPLAAAAATKAATSAVSNLIGAGKRSREMTSGSGNVQASIVTGCKRLKPHTNADKNIKLEGESNLARANSRTSPPAGSDDGELRDCKGPIKKPRNRRRRRNRTRKRKRRCNKRRIVTEDCVTCSDRLTSSRTGTNFHDGRGVNNDVKSPRSRLTQAGEASSTSPKSPTLVSVTRHLFGQHLVFQ